MHKAWRVIGSIALVCLLIGVICIAAAFFMGSSPVVIQEHGTLTEYISRLQTNWDVFMRYVDRSLSIF